MRILKNIYDLLNQMILDLNSTRERILWFVLCVFVFTLVYSKDAVISGLVSGWVTIIMGFYFASKHHEHSKDRPNPPTDRNPEGE
jgi:hypothetical protein